MSMKRYTTYRVQFSVIPWTPAFFGGGYTPLVNTVIEFCTSQNGKTSIEPSIKKKNLRDTMSHKMWLCGREWWVFSNLIKLFDNFWVEIIEYLTSYDCFTKLFPLLMTWKLSIHLSLIGIILKWGFLIRELIFYLWWTFCPHLLVFCVVSSFTTFRPNFTSGLLQGIYRDLG